MNPSQPWQSYSHISTQTAPPSKLVVMLYDGAIRFLERALAGFASEDPLEFHQTINNNVIRAQAVLSELNGSLNLDQGGELAQTLRRLYNYMDRRLTESNLQKNPEGIRDAIRRLTLLRKAWDESLGQARAPAESGTEFAGLSICG